jgi:hypothetical protein
MSLMGKYSKVTSGKMRSFEFLKRVEYTVIVVL